MRLTLVPLVLAVAALVATASPAAASYHTCDIQGKAWTNHGSWYVSSLAVRHVSCRTGKRVALAFQRCRHAHGIRGRCHHRVRHFRCHETRAYPIGQFTGKVVCRRGSKRVRHTYTQFT